MSKTQNMWNDLLKCNKFIQVQFFKKIIFMFKKTTDIFIWLSNLEDLPEHFKGNFLIIFFFLMGTLKKS